MSAFRNGPFCMMGFIHGMLWGSPKVGVMLEIRVGWTLFENPLGHSRYTKFLGLRVKASCFA